MSISIIRSIFVHLNIEADEWIKIHRKLTVNIEGFNSLFAGIGNRAQGNQTTFGCHVNNTGAGDVDFRGKGNNLLFV